MYEANKYETEEDTDNIVPELPKNSGFMGRWNRLDEIFRANNTIQLIADKFRVAHLAKYGLE